MGGTETVVLVIWGGTLVNRKIAVATTVGGFNYLANIDHPGRRLPVVNNVFIVLRGDLVLLEDEIGRRPENSSSNGNLYPNTGDETARFGSQSTWLVFGAPLGLDMRWGMDDPPAGYRCR